jgi:Major intrinsic protein
VIPYIIVQVIGGIVAAAVFYLILSGAPAAGKWNDFAAISNTYGSEGHFPLLQVALIETVLTALFVIVIVGVTSSKAAAGFAPLAICRNPGPPQHDCAHGESRLLAKLIVGRYGKAAAARDRCAIVDLSGTPPTS